MQNIASFLILSHPQPYLELAFLRGRVHPHGGCLDVSPPTCLPIYPGLVHHGRPRRGGLQRRERSKCVHYGSHCRRKNEECYAREFLLRNGGEGDGDLHNYVEETRFAIVSSKCDKFDVHLKQVMSPTPVLG